MKCPTCLFKKCTYLFTKERFNIHKCEKCGLLFCSNTPSILKLKEYYKKDEYCCKSKNRLLVKLENLYFLRRFKKFIKKGARILDYGCGRGELMEILNKKGCYAEGIDFSRQNIKIVRKKGLNIKSEINVKDKEKYDIIIMKYSLEHMTEPIKLLKSLKKVLKKGGNILIDVPNINSKDFKILGKEWRIICPPYHLLYFNKKSIRKLLEDCGLKVIKLEDSRIPSYVFPFNLPPIISIFIKISYLLMPRILIKEEGSSILVIGKKA